MALRLLSARVMRPYAPVLRQSATLAAFRTYASKSTLFIICINMNTKRVFDSQALH